MRKIVLIVLLTVFAGIPTYAVDMGSIVKAQVVLGQVTRVMDKYAEIQALIDAGTIELAVADPMQGGSGKYVLPFDAEGNATEWAGKALTAQAGSKVGEMAGNKAAGMLAAKVPFGGFLAGGIKSKSKELGAVTAIGGWDYIRGSSSLSFDRLEDYSVYMHSRFYGTPDYEQALAAAMAIYPKLEKSHKRSVDRAYKEAKKRARKLRKKK